MNPFAWSQSLMRFSMSSTIAVSLGLQSLQLPGSGLLCMARRLASALTRFLARINNSAVRLPLAALLISFLAAVRRWLMSAGMRPLGQSGVKSSSTAQLTESKELAVSGSYTHSVAARAGGAVGAWDRRVRAATAERVTPVVRAWVAIVAGRDPGYAGTSLAGHRVADIGAAILIGPTAALDHQTSAGRRVAKRRTALAAASRGFPRYTFPLAVARLDPVALIVVVTRGSVGEFGELAAASTVGQAHTRARRQTFGHADARLVDDGTLCVGRAAVLYRHITAAMIGTRIDRARVEIVAVAGLHAWLDTGRVGLHVGAHAGRFRGRRAGRGR